MTVPYNILSSSKKWRSPCKSRVRATLLFINCRKRDYSKISKSVKRVFLSVLSMTLCFPIQDLFPRTVNTSGRHAELIQPKLQKQCYRVPVPGHLTAHTHFDTFTVSGRNDLSDRLYNSRMKIIAAIRNFLIFTAGLRQLPPFFN